MLLIMLVNLIFSFNPYVLEHLLTEQARSSELKLYMVGDSPHSDIKGGNENGFETILVKTGLYTEGMETCNATHIV
jgi:ribonucleotide monophosphatase NagD (HAD superfamily)